MCTLRTLYRAFYLSHTHTSLVELVEEGLNGVSSAAHELTNPLAGHGNHGKAAVVDLLVLVREGLLGGLVVELGESRGVGLDITGDLVLLLGGEHLEGGAEEENLGNAGDGPDLEGGKADGDVSEGDTADLTGETSKVGHEGPKGAEHRNTAVLDLDSAVLVELLDIAIGGEAEGVP